MKKTEMIKKNYEFKKIFEKGKYFSGQYIEAFIKKDEYSKDLFLGIAIGVKIAKAVKRNHIKRLIRESYYFFEPKIKHGGNIVILWKKKVDINKATFKNINLDMENILKKAEMI